VPKEVLDSIHVNPVDTLAQALAITLRDTTLREGRLFFNGEQLSELH
jgi:hypothetical protein